MAVLEVWTGEKLGVDKEVTLFVLCGVISVQIPLLPNTDSLSCVFC
jgi:hypothetical protein